MPVVNPRPGGGRAFLHLAPKIAELIQCDVDGEVAISQLYSDAADLLEEKSSGVIHVVRYRI